MFKPMMMIMMMAVAAMVVVTMAVAMVLVKTIVLCKMFSRWFFANKKINYDDQNVEIWRRTHNVMS